MSERLDHAVRSSRWIRGARRSAGGRSSTGRGRDRRVVGAGLVGGIGISKSQLVEFSAGGRGIVAVDAGLAKVGAIQVDRTCDRVERQIPEAVGAEALGGLLGF